MRGWAPAARGWVSAEGPSRLWVHRGGYLYFQGNNGMQTREGRTTKQTTLGCEEAAREIAMQSLWGDIVPSEPSAAVCLFPG